MTQVNEKNAVMQVRYFLNVSVVNSGVSRAAAASEM